MTGYRVTFEDLADLVAIASRTHRKQIAESVGLGAPARRGEVYFRAPDGAEVPLEEAHRRTQADPPARRWTYNLYMHYLHFG